MTATVLPTAASTAEPTRPRTRRWPHLVLAVVVVAALVLRWQFVDVQSADYRTFLQSWYATLDQGGFAALSGSFSNYNTPYLVLMWLLTFLPVEPLLAVKGLSVVFDLLLAGFAYALVRQLRPASAWAPVLGASLVLLLPTVVLNGSAWAQCDALYASLCLGSLYFLIRGRPWLACAFFGLAFAFKLQAVFFLPVLVVVLVLLRQRLLSLLAVPATFLAALVPALVAGRSLVSQLAVYPAQVTDSSGAVGGGGRPTGGARTGGFGGGNGFPGGGADRGQLGGRGGGGAVPGGGPGGGGGGTTTSGAYTHNAPTWYAWLPSDAGTVWKYAGLALAALVVLAVGVWLLRRRRPLTGAEVVLLAATATLVVPLLLPEMHERYFYLAEVLTVLAAFADRRFVVPAAAIQLASTSTYLSYLWGSELFSLSTSAVVALLGAVMALVLLVLDLRRSQQVVPEPRGRDVTVAPAGLGA